MKKKEPVWEWVEWAAGKLWKGLRVLWNQTLKLATLAISIVAISISLFVHFNAPRLEKIEDHTRAISEAATTIDKSLASIAESMEKGAVSAELRVHMENIHKSILAMRCARCVVGTQPQTNDSE